MHEFSVKAKPANRKAHTLSVACLIIAAILFASRFILEKYVGIVDLGTVGFITASVFLYTKYIAAVYYYETLITEDGEALFIVRKLVGKRSTTLCRISYAEILSIEKETREEFKAHKTPRGTVKYLYTPTLYPDTLYRIQMRSAYERAEVVIECSDELAALIAKWSLEARSARSLEDEE